MPTTDPTACWGNMSETNVSYFGGEVKETQRHKLGKLLGTLTRNFLLMSATPHNGKEADFQLFMGTLGRPGE